MLQRYDITMDDQANCLLIKEFAVVDTKSHKYDEYRPVDKDYSLIQEVSYDLDIIRTADQEGSDALISELRTDDFFPVGSCAKIIAEGVSGLLNGKPDTVSEVFFDDRTLLSTPID